MPKIAITNNFVSKILCRDSQSKCNYFDDIVKGLMLEVRKSGGKTYYFSYQNYRGSRSYLKIGCSTYYSLSEARDKAIQYQNLLKDGLDPAEARATKCKVPTFADFVQQDFLPYIRTYKRSWRCDVSLLNNHLLPALGNQYLDAITRKDVQRLISSRLDDGRAPGTCDRMLILTRHIYSMAIKWQIPGVKSNPAKEVDLLKVDNKRERFLREDELSRLYDAVATSDNQMLKYIVPMLLLTGARKREVLDAKWSDFDYGNRIWKIPHTKLGRPRFVPMSDGVLAILAQIPREDCEYVFANPETQKPYVSVHYAWATARKRAGLEDVRMHDLRHSFASILINSGRTLYEVQHLLGHTQVKTTERYAHLQQDTLLRAANVATAVVGSALPQMRFALTTA